MTVHLLGSVLAFMAAVIPLIALAAVALIGHMIGEWGRDMLLAYSAVLMGFLSGIGAAGSTMAVFQIVNGIGAVVAVGALLVGGPAGLTVLAVAYAGSAALVLVKPEVGVSWPLPAIAAVVCFIVAFFHRT